MNYEIEIWNDIALIKDDAYFTKWVKEVGKLDHHTGFLNFLRPYLKGTILDIGANIGTHTIHYLERGNVIAFEPNPIAYTCLHYNLTLSSRSKAAPNHITLHNVAVGDKLGTIDLVPCGDNYGAIYTTTGTSIKTITIDSLNVAECTFMKIDVEGDEIAVLNGAAETITKFKPVMCIEANVSTLVRKGHTVDQLVAAIEALGYTVEGRTPDISADLLCLPK